MKPYGLFLAAGLVFTATAKPIGGNGLAKRHDTNLAAARPTSTDTTLSASATIPDGYDPRATASDTSTASSSGALSDTRNAPVSSVARQISVATTSSALPTYPGGFGGSPYEPPAYGPPGGYGFPSGFVTPGGFGPSAGFSNSDQGRLGGSSASSFSPTSNTSATVVLLSASSSTDDAVSALTTSLFSSLYGGPSPIISKNSSTVSPSSARGETHTSYTTQIITVTITGYEPSTLGGSASSELPTQSTLATETNSIPLRSSSAFPSSQRPTSVTNSSRPISSPVTAGSSAVPSSNITTSSGPLSRSTAFSNVTSNKAGPTDSNLPTTLSAIGTGAPSSTGSSSTEGPIIVSNSTTTVSKTVTASSSSLARGGKLSTGITSILTSAPYLLSLSYGYLTSPITVVSSTSYSNMTGATIGALSATSASVAESTAVMPGTGSSKLTSSPSQVRSESSNATSIVTTTSYRNSAPPLLSAGSGLPAQSGSTGRPVVASNSSATTQTSPSKFSSKPASTPNRSQAPLSTAVSTPIFSGSAVSAMSYLNTAGTHISTGTTPIASGSSTSEERAGAQSLLSSTASPGNVSSTLPSRTFSITSGPAPFVTASLSASLSAGPSVPTNSSTGGPISTAKGTSSALLNNGSSSTASPTGTTNSSYVVGPTSGGSGSGSSTTAPTTIFSTTTSVGATSIISTPTTGGSEAGSTPCPEESRYPTNPSSSADTASSDPSSNNSLAIPIAASTSSTFPSLTEFPSATKTPPNPTRPGYAGPGSYFGADEPSDGFRGGFFGRLFGHHEREGRFGGF